MMTARASGAARTTSIGQAAEIRVALDLAERGWQVFSPAVGYPATCDLLAMSADGQRVIRVEVKSCGSKYLRADGKSFAFGNPVNPAKAHLADVVAHVVRMENHAIYYTPDLSSFEDARETA